MLFTLYVTVVTAKTPNAKTASDIIVPEMNLGQIVHEVERAAHGEANVHLIGKIGGILHKPDEIYDKIKEING